MVLAVRADIEPDHQAFVVDALGVDDIRARRGIDLIEVLALTRMNPGVAVEVTY